MPESIALRHGFLNAEFGNELLASFQFRIPHYEFRINTTKGMTCKVMPFVVYLLWSKKVRIEG